MKPEDLGEAAYESYRSHIKRSLLKRGRATDIKPWKNLAPVTKEAWVRAVLEVVLLTRPESEVLREAAQKGLITVRVRD